MLVQYKVKKMTVNTLEGILTETIETKRLKTRVLQTKNKNGTPVLFIHGNASSATFWEEIMLQLPEKYWGLAPDLRGYGDADTQKLVDATRGCDDWVDDIIALLDKLKIKKTHICAHSLGGNVVWALLGSHPDRFLSVTQVNPGSPYGFGGTKDIAGNPTYSDFGCSGGGSVNPDFVKLMKEGDRSESNPQASPRVVMNSFYFKPPFKPAREEDLLSSLISEHVGEKQYPGDSTTSTNWPGVAPGKWGPINALSPKYLLSKAESFVDVQNKPKILWVRGSDDQIVSDNSFFDFGTLGKLGAVPGWPGEDICPPQPMVSQTRSALEKYSQKGGSYTEVVIDGTGHSPYIEKPAEFNQHFHKFLAEN